MAIIKLRDKDGNAVEIPTLVGESAYNIAVKNGYTGTETEWIKSLKGTDGVSPTIRTIEAPKGYVLEIIDANGENYISLLHGKDGVSPTVSVTETDTGHDVDITDANGSHSFSVTNGLDGSNKITVKSKTYVMDNSEGMAFTEVCGQGTIGFVVYEGLPANARIIDFSVVYKNIAYTSSELILSGIISGYDIVRINPTMPYDSGWPGYIPVVIGCKTKTAELYANIDNTYDLQTLTLYYVEVE